MTKLLLTRDFPQANIAFAEAHFDATIRRESGGLSEAEVSAALQEYDAIMGSIGDAFTARAFEMAEPMRCGIIANFGVGYNHIDTVAAAAHGVTVTNTPDTVTDATADIGMTLMLMACRRAGEGERLVRAGRWQGWGPTEMLGTHVTGKTLGIVGMGRIGQAVAHRAHYGFGMRIIFYNRSNKATEVPALQYDRLNEMLGDADIVIICVPGGAANASMIGAEQFAAMKDSGVFINIARGDIVDEPALISALQEGQIAAAGLDVFAAEPVVPEAFLTMENAVLLPHLGTAALEVREEMGQMALDNIMAHVRGETPPQKV